MPYPLFVVDAFTRTRFGGNQAAVMPLAAWLPEALMQAIATENNLSETAFVVKDDNGVFHIRWFSPLTEIDFCGHATLASAHVLFGKNPQASRLRFYAKAVGELVVTKAEDGLIEMSFPNRAPEVCEAPAALLAGLEPKPRQVLKNAQAYFAVYDSEAEVRALNPDLEALKALAPFDVVATAPGDSHDFVSRYFWPANGGAEDPVTGSIHAGLTPYWAERLGKAALHAFQASARGGELFCRLEGERVLVAGYCVSYLKGSIELGEAL